MLRRSFFGLFAGLFAPLAASKSVATPSPTSDLLSAIEGVRKEHAAGSARLDADLASGAQTMWLEHQVNALEKAVLLLAERVEQIAARG